MSDRQRMIALRCGRKDRKIAEKACTLMTSRATPASVAAEIREVFTRGGSAEHAKGVQWFFKDEIKSHGWRTADMRRLARQTSRSLQQDCGLEFVVKVADRLFAGDVLEEKVFAVLLLEKLNAQLGATHFRLFERWLDRISSWADHDGLVHYLIGPMIVADPTRVKRVFEWARSPNRWHRRAACVALIQGTRQRKFFPQIKRLSRLLLKDEDDMVQKGLGWLLRETAKAEPQQTVPYLLTLRTRAPRLVLRTACERLSPRDRVRILGLRAR